MNTFDASLTQREEQAAEELRRHILQQAWDWTYYSNCRDKQLGAILVKDGRIIGRGSNLCAPPPYEYGDVLPYCLRDGARRGTQRKRCYGFHAEVMACLSARRDKEGNSVPVTERDLKRFAWWRFGIKPGNKQGERTKRVLQKRFSLEDRERLRGAVLYLVGVAHVCDVCDWLLEWLGVERPKNNIVPRRIMPDDLERRIEEAERAEEARRLAAEKPEES